MDVGAIYTATRGQVITRGMDGMVVDIMIPAIESAMRIYGIPKDQRWECLRRVQKLFHYFQAERVQNEGS